MNTVSGCAVLQLRSASSGGHPCVATQALVRHGLAVHTINDLAALARQLQSRPDGHRGGQVVLLDGRDSDAVTTVMTLRTLQPGLGVVAQVQLDDEERLIRLLQVGIDLYWPAGGSPELLLALVLRLMRRPGPESQAVAQAPSSRIPDTDTDSAPTATDASDRTGRRSRQHPGSWQLVEQGWVMCSPDGQSVPLTTGERAFLTTLLNSPQHKATHAELIAAVNAAYNQVEGRTHQSRLGVMVSRMRSKFEKAGVPLPLRSIHNWGYMFVSGLPDR